MPEALRLHLRSWRWRALALLEAAILGSALLALEFMIWGLLAGAGSGLMMGAVALLVALPTFGLSMATIGVAAWTIMHRAGWTGWRAVLTTGALAAVMGAAILLLVTSPAGASASDLAMVLAMSLLLAAPGTVAAWTVRRVAYSLDAA